MKHFRSIGLLMALLFGAGCTGDPDTGSFAAPSIQDVYAATGAAPTQVIVVCRVSTMEGIKDYGILFGKQSLEKIPADNLKDNAFSVLIEDLEWSTDYRFQAYIDGGRGQIVSDIKTWTSDDEVPPPAEILKMTPGLGGDAGKVSFNCLIKNYAFISGKNNLQCGVCYSPIQENPTLMDASSESSSISESGAYTIGLAGLTPSITYHFRTWTQIGSQTTYGDALKLTIPSGADVVVTGDYSDLSPYKVTLHGCYNTNDIPSSCALVCGFEVSSKAILSEQPDDKGQFSSTISELEPNKEYQYRAFLRIEGSTFYGEKRTFQTQAMPGSEEGYVDLGLSVLWASRNLGALNPEDPGYLFAWGEIEPSEGNWGWENYKWCMGTDKSIFKYTRSTYTTLADEKTILDPEDDAAHVLLGGKWRMPTKEEVYELLQYTDFSDCNLIIINDLTGILITSKIEGFSEESIFIPRWDCPYWTSELDDNDSCCAKSFTPNYYISYYEFGRVAPRSRCLGTFIRPVRER